MNNIKRSLFFTVIRNNILKINKTNFKSATLFISARKNTTDNKVNIPFSNNKPLYHKDKSYWSILTTFHHDSIEFRTNENNVKKYPYIWLRDHCKCSTCFNQRTEELEFDLSEIPLDIKPSSVRNLNDNCFEIICRCFY